MFGLGGDAADDSGSLMYTLVKFAGFPLAAGNELNGISFGGVGTGTNVEYVQVHNNSDDGVEFFGGTANVSHLVLTGNDDDSIDTDLGYQGAIQFALVVQREDGGDNIVEASSEPGAGVTPLSDATISNFTFVGSTGASGNGLRLNTGTVGQYANGVVVHPEECIRWEATAGDATAGYIQANDPNFDSVLFDCGTTLAVAADDAAAAAAAVADDANNVETASSLSGFVPFINGAAENGVTEVDPTTLDPFFVAAPYIGAVEDIDDRWWAGWSCGLEAGSSC